MKKHILIALVCASLMMITPFTVVAQENKITGNLIEEPNVDRLVAQILNKYEQNPIVNKFGDLIKYLLELIVNIVKSILQFMFIIVVGILLFIILWLIA